MFIKPRTSVGNEPALLYRRFTSLEKSMSKDKCYMTYDGKYWLFDAETGEFMESEERVKNVVSVYNDSRLTFKSNVYKYTPENGWEITDDTQGETLDLIYNNIARYQTNNYYYVGSFDYMRRGSATDTDTQPVGGLITPLTSLEIKYFTDDLTINHDDLVALEGHLYMIESTEVVQKRMPRAFNVHFATLTSIV